MFEQVALRKSTASPRRRCRHGTRGQTCPSGLLDGSGHRSERRSVRPCGAAMLAQREDCLLRAAICCCFYIASGLRLRPKCHSAYSRDRSKLGNGDDAYLQEDLLIVSASYRTE